MESGTTTEAKTTTGAPGANGGSGARSIEVNNPATGETIATIPAVAPEEVGGAGREGTRGAARLAGARLRGPGQGAEACPEVGHPEL